MSACTQCYIGACSVHTLAKPRPAAWAVDAAKFAVMLDALEEVRGELATRADVDDGADGPRPDWCMQLLQVVEDAIRKATKP